LLHGSGSSYPTIETPQKLTLQLHMVSLTDWIEIQGRFGEYNQLYSPISPQPENPWSSHNAVGTFLRMKHIVQLVQNSQSHQT